MKARSDNRRNLEGNPESARRIGFKARLPEILRQAAVFKVETRGLVPLGSSIIGHGN